MKEKIDKKQITMCLPSELLEQLREKAQRKGIPLNTYIILILQEFKNQ